MDFLLEILEKGMSVMTSFNLEIETSKNKIPVSVVIPCYNSSKTIEDAVNSIINQTKTPKEIILVDDASSDNGKTLKRLNEIKLAMQDKISIIVIAMPVNKGAAAARNRGLEIASQDFIAFLDADDVWKNKKMEIQMKAFFLYPECGLIASNINQNKFKKFYWKKFNYYTYISLNNLIFKNFFPTPAVIIKKEVVKKIGYFNETQRYAEEGDFFIRIAAHYRCLLINESLVECGKGKPVFGHSGLSGNLRKMEEGELKNLKMAYKCQYISFYMYIIAVFYSLIKYIRRIIIVKMRRFQND